MRMFNDDMAVGMSDTGGKIMDRFRDCVAIVTGGGSGIGRALSRALAARGAKVVVADINLKGAGETADAIAAAGGCARAVKLDVTDQEAVRGLVERTVSEFGRLDYMVNNAGIGMGGNFEDTEPAHWKQIIDINLWGVIYGSLYAYRAMLKQGSGHIVNVSSLAGLTPSFIAPYAATKYGVVGLTLSLRIQAALRGIRASVVCPGFVRTPIYDTSVDVSNELSEAEKKELFAKFERLMIEPDRCAEIILKGIRNNRAIIPVTKLAWMAWRLNRLFPELLVRLTTRQTKKFAERRKKPAGVKDRA